ncbi:MAG: SNF2-related protein [Capnocytophaga sp.]|uniref:DEAD/DEAH box helicase n=1 Tax=Capnocytophaga sp. TaxID=44737 RepID=UPI003FA0144F
MQLFFDFSFHPLIELVLPNAYLAEERNGYWYFFKKATRQVLEHLPQWHPSAAEEEALALTEALQPSVLYEKHLKKGDTFEKIYQNKSSKKYIQEQIEEKSHQLLQHLKTHQCLLTIGYTPKEDLSKKLVRFSTELYTPLLTFEKKEEGISYRLSLEKGDCELLPYQHRIEFVNNLYAWIVLDQELIQIAPLRASHLSPFLNKEYIFIPERSLQAYFDKFLKKILRSAKVKTIGFDLIEKMQLERTEIDLYHDFLSNHYKIRLFFDYNGYQFVSMESKNVQSYLDIGADNSIKIYHYQRDAKAEAAQGAILEDLGFKNDSGSYVVEGTTPFTTYFHLLHQAKALEAAGFSFRPFCIEDNKEVALSLPELIFNDTTSENDWFDLSIEVQQGDIRFHFKDLIPNLKENDPLYLLPNGKVFVIPQEWFSRFGTLAKYSKVKEDKLLLPKNNYALLEGIPEVKPTTLVEKVQYQPSANLKATLRPYQVAGVEWLLQHHYNGVGACLADDMGLGKTLQTIALLVAIHDALPERLIDSSDLFAYTERKKEPLKVLIILPSSLIFNWYDETKRFAPHLQCTQYVGTAKERKQKVRRLTNYDIVFTSYPLVEHDVKDLQGLAFRYIILDESQRIKNKNSKTFKAINSLNGSHRIALSGTPIENALSDLWAQMQFINPNQLGSYAFFYKNYEVEISKKKNVEALEELKKIVGKHILRRTKEQVLEELPELEEQIAYCPMTEEQGQWYEAEKSKVRNQLLHLSSPIDQFNALQMLTKLRQISNHPILAAPESTLPSGKYEEVVSYMEELVAARHKALVFSSMVQHLALYEAWCQEHKIKYAKLTGSVPTGERKTQVEYFQQQAEVSFFFISLKAGEVGLNLTEASYVLLLDPWWNPFSEKQAIARAHRMRQRNKVNVVRFVSKGTIEEKIIHLQKSKTELFENVVDENSLVKEVIEHLDTLLE